MDQTSVSLLEKLQAPGDREAWDRLVCQTLSYRTDLEDGKSTQSSVRFADASKEVWRFKVTDAAGKVYFDSEITATRRMKE